MGWSDDWPAERHDVRRSGISQESLDLPLVESWRVQTAQPAPAWPPAHFILLDRMDFDYAPQPVVADGIVCFGSTTDDTLRAMDLQTGKLRWRFVTGGPIRLAPQIYQHRVYAGADDGCVYCIEAATGELVWKFDATPHDEQFIGNGRMISRWPIRSGVLAADDCVYFLAGMWATEGIFAYAVDARTGREIWCNDTCGYAGVDYNHLLTLENAGELRHGVHDGDFGVYGLTPQGALAATQDVLLVPNGYNSPAGLDRKTGRLLFAEPQAGTGGSWVMTDREAYYSVYQHRNRRILITKRDAHTGERLAIQFHGVHNVTAVPNNVPHLHHETGKTSNLIVDGRVISKNAYAMVLAGTTLVLGHDGYVTALDLATDAELWRADVDGKAYGIAVADGRIVATTDRGTVHCFSAATTGTETVNPAATDRSATDARTPPVNAVARRCSEALQAVGMDRGYALLLGDLDGTFSESVAAKTQLRIVTFCELAEAAHALRQRLVDTTTLYGARIHVTHRRSPRLEENEENTERSLPFGQHFANAVIITEPTQISSDELFRVLRPCGGVMLFVDRGQPEFARVSQDLSSHIDQGEITVLAHGEFAGLVRGQLPGALDWNTPQATDERVTWPLRPLWFGGPSSAQVTDFKNGNARPPAAAGRYFVLGEDTLSAVDAYNGFVLWTRPIPKRSPDLKEVGGLLYETEHVWSRELRDAHTRRVRANHAHVYLTLGAGVFQNESPGCVVLDAQTGAQQAIYAPFQPSAELQLDQPLARRLAIDQDHRGQLTLSKSARGLTIELRTTDPVVTHLDEWELFFDFRPRQRRYGLYEPGVFQVKVSPPVVPGGPTTWKPGVGVDHPRFQVTGERTASGSEARLTLAWDEVRPFTDQPCESFGFAAILNSHDGGPDERIGLSYLYCDSAASGINNGWANVALVDAPSSPVRPDVIAGGWPDLPKAQTTRLWPKAIEAETGNQLRVHPLTGEPGPRIFRSGIGTCGGFDFSSTSIVHRSGAAKVLGIYDFADDSGLRTFIGATGGCAATTTTALGMTIVSEAKARCVCTFPFRTTVALAPGQRRLNEDWAIFFDRNVDTLVRQAHLNLGAFGDRRDDNAKLWLGFPRPVEDSQALGYPRLPGTNTEAFLPGIWPTGRSANLQVPLEIECYAGGGPFRFNADRAPIAGTATPWMYASGYRGIRRATLRVNFFRPLATQALAAPPQVDAVLADGEWPATPQLHLPGTKTDLFLAHDAAYLYVAARRLPNIARPGKAPWKGKSQGHDAAIWQDDSWELFLGDTISTRVAHFGVSITGARFDAIGHRNAAQVENAAGSSTWQSAASANDEAAVVEMAIPWATVKQFGLDRDRLAINFMANQDAQIGEAITYLGASGRAGCANLTPLGLGVAPMKKPRSFRLALHFAVFPDSSTSTYACDILVQGRPAERLEIESPREGNGIAVVREFRHVEATETLSFALETTQRPPDLKSLPVVCAIEVEEADAADSE